MSSDVRIRLHDWLLEQEGKPYIWGSKGFDSYDCSGLATCGIYMMGGPDWRMTHGSAKLWETLEPTDAEHLVPLDLALYGRPGRISHVVFAWGDGRVFGACGGGSQTLTPKAGACVQFKPAVLYRPDLRGYRRIPFL